MFIIKSAKKVVKAFESFEEATAWVSNHSKRSYDIVKFDF